MYKGTQTDTQTYEYSILRLINHNFKHSRHCPESLRWLVSSGRIKEAEETLERAAKFNNKTIPPEILQEKTEPLSKEKSRGLCSYFTHWKTTMYYIVLSYEL